MKKGVLIVLGILLLAGAGGGGWYYYKNYYAPPEAEGDPVYVTSVGSLTGYSVGVTNRYAGVVEPQETVKVNIESGKVVKEVEVKVGQEVKQGELLFHYDLTSIQQSLKEAQLELDRLKNEALSLQDQIATLEKEKKQAPQDSQLSYTIEIETNKMNLQKNEYDQQSKAAQIERLESSTENTEVRSEIDGVIQKIDTSKLTSDDGDMLQEGVDMMNYSGENDDSAFITILSTGAYRVKGKVNELNAMSIIEGSPVIIRSRVDEEQTWHGLMGSVDRDNASSDDENNMYYYGMMSDSQTSSSSYPFYVELDSSEGLMLGQHVYIELDNGQEDKKEGLWLSEFYIVDADTEEPYVWAADSRKRLEKRKVTLGGYDEALGEYEILDGLTVKDSIAYPEEGLEEGRATTTSAEALTTDLPSYSEGEMPEDGMMELPESEPYPDEVMEPLDGEFIDEYPEDGEILEEYPEDEEFLEEFPMDEEMTGEEITYEDEMIDDGMMYGDMPEDADGGEIIEEMPEEMGAAG